MASTAVPKRNINPYGDANTAGALRWLMEEITHHRELIQAAVTMIQTYNETPPETTAAECGFTFEKISKIPPWHAEDHYYRSTTLCNQREDKDAAHVQSRRRTATLEARGLNSSNKAASSHKSNTREPRELRPKTSSRSMSRSDCTSTALSVHQPRVPLALNSTLNSELTDTVGLQVCLPPQLGKGDHGTGTKSGKPEPATKRVSFTCEPSPCQVAVQGYCKPTSVTANAGRSICTPSPTSTTGAEQPINKATLSHVKVSLSRKPVYCSVKCDSPLIPKAKGEILEGPPCTSLPLGLEVRHPHASSTPAWTHSLPIAKWPEKITAQDVKSQTSHQKCDGSRFTFCELDGTPTKQVPSLPQGFRVGAKSLALSIFPPHTLSCVTVHGVRTTWQATQLANLFEGHKWVTFRHKEKDSTGLYDMSFVNAECTHTKDLPWLTRKAVLHALLPCSHKRSQVPIGPAKYNVVMTYNKSVAFTLYNQLSYYIYTTKKNWLEFGDEVTTPARWNTKHWIEPACWTTLPDPLEEEYYPESVGGTMPLHF
eukprot:TRINITY_DN67620_c1_g2_i2.p1 TRINITY_DN67620_c1_g2~~TRINITY_DN67620_c1_g2_i2.p1  ORF type:complete len:540 (+),score=9.34 TRINITY_DN67620_c1_g2_i2:67-1686(+)